LFDGVVWVWKAFLVIGECVLEKAGDGCNRYTVGLTRNLVVKMMREDFWAVKGRQYVFIRGVFEVYLRVSGIA